MKTALTAMLTIAIVAFAVPAMSKSLPKDVADAYKIYLMAQEADDVDAMVSAAYRAWQAAETSLGDSQTTGDLAHNFVMLGLTPEGVKYEKRWDAFERAIELSKFHGDIQSEVEIQRRLLMIDELIESPKAAFRGGRFEMIVKGQPELRELNNVIIAAGFEDSTYAAEMTAMSSKYHWMKGSWRASVEMADKALSQFDSATLRTSSVHPLTVRFYKARSLDALGETVSALLVYQDIVDITIRAGLDEKASGTPFAEMFTLQDELALQGNLKEATDLGYRVISGEDFAGGDERPIVRIPPIMPPQAERSGWVKVRFDVGKDGRPSNVEVIDASEKVFKRTAVKSVEQWVYATGDNSAERLGVESVISFRLTNERGRIIPYKRPQPE